MKLFEKNALLLWTFAALAGLALLSSAASVRADARDRAARWTPLEAAKEREHAGVAEVDDLRVAAGVTSSGIAAMHMLVQLVRESKNARLLKSWAHQLVILL